MTNRTWVGLIVSVVGALVIGLFVSSLFDPLWLVNGFPFPLTVRVGSQSFTVPAEGRLSAGTFRNGVLAIEATSPDGGFVDRRTLNFDRLGVYNPLGAAPLYTEVITYMSGSRTPPAPSLSHKCGQVFVSERVDFAFTEPPRTVSLNKHETSARRTVMNLERGGYETCVEVLGATVGGARLLADLDHVFPNEAWAWRAVMVLAAAGHTKEALEQAAALPRQTLADQRWYEAVLVSAGQRTEAIAAARARYEGEANAENLHGLVTLLPAAEALPLLEAARKAARTQRDDPLLHLDLAKAAFALGRDGVVVNEGAWFAENVSEAAVQRDGNAWLELLTAATIRSGHAKDALALVQRAFDEGELSMAQVLLIDRASLVANSEPDPTAFKRMKKPKSAEGEKYVRYTYPIQLGLRPKGPSKEFPVWASLTNPIDARAQVRQLLPFESSLLSEEPKWLLLAECVRVSDQKCLEELWVPSTAGVDELRAFITEGTAPFVLDRLSVPARAAVLLARARELASMEDPEADKAFDAVRTADPLRGLAVHAIDIWKPAPPSLRSDYRLELVKDVKLQVVP